MSNKDYSKAENIRALRKTLRLTQAQFAEVLGVSYVTVNRWENGHIKPSHLAIEKLRNISEARTCER